MDEKRLKPNVITLTGRLSIKPLDGIQSEKELYVDEQVAPVNFPINDTVVGCFFGSKDLTKRVDRGYTGPEIPKQSFPRSFFLMICPNLDNQTKLVNVKVYNNGVLHLTGCASEKEGNDICKYLANLCNSCEIKGITKDGIVEAEPCDIKMVNGCCALNYQLRKNKLAKVLSENGYRVHNTEISPALKVYFMWNKKSRKPGICNCTHYCSEGKGTGNGNGQCNRTTISILHTGVIHFMGSKSFEQMVAAHAKIIEFMAEHRAEVSRSSPEELMRLAMMNQKISQISI